MIDPELSEPIEERILAPAVNIKSAILAGGRCAPGTLSSGIRDLSQVLVRSTTTALLRAAHASRASELPIPATPPSVIAFLEAFDASWSEAAATIAQVASHIITAAARRGKPLSPDRAIQLHDIICNARMIERACRDLAIYKATLLGEALAPPATFPLAAFIEELPSIGRIDHRWDDVTIAFEDDSWPVQLVLPESHLAFILFPLIENALRWSEHQTTISICARRELSRTLVSVEGGQPDDLPDEAFLPFWRRDHGCRYPGNLGLGLPIARQLARINFGDILQAGNAMILVMPNRSIPGCGILSPERGHA